MKKKIKKKKKTLKKPDELFFQLDGKVFIIEKKNGKIVEKTELDGNVVLQSLILTLEQGLKLINIKE